MVLKISISFLALAFVMLGLGCRDKAHQEGAPANPVAASSALHEAHDEHAQHAAVPTLEPGQLWPTDEALRAAMQRIRAAVDRAASVQEQKRFTATDAQALAATVEENIAYMIANCKLDPKPDAALHALIGRMLSVVASLKQENRQDATSDDGVSHLRAVLHDYQATFDHPGWPRLEGV